MENDREIDPSIDVVAEEDIQFVSDAVPPYNRARAVAAMNEVEKFMVQLRGHTEDVSSLKDGKIDEDPLVKTYTRYLVCILYNW